MIENEGDVRDAILLLVNACNDYQTRNLALTSAFRSLRQHPNEKVGEWELQAEALKTYNAAEAAVESQAQDVKAALKGSGPFVDALIRFATRYYSEFDQFLPRPKSH